MTGSRSSRETEEKRPASGGKNFRGRLFRAFLVVGIPIFAAISLSSYFFLQRSVNAGICEEQSLELASVQMQLETVMRDTERMSEEILFNEAVQEMLAASYAGEQYPSDTQVSYYINNLVANRDYIDGVVLLGTDHTLYSTERIFTGLSSWSYVQEKWWFNALSSQQAAAGWYPYADRRADETHRLANGTAQAENTILFARPVYSMQDYRTLLGYMLIYLEKDYLQSVWDGCDWGKTANLMLADENGALLATNAAGADYSDMAETALIPTDAENETDGFRAGESRIVHTAQGSFVCTSRPFRDEGWTIGMIVPLREVNQSTVHLRLQMLLLVAAFVFVMFLLSRLGARSIAQPVTELSRIMDTAYRGVFERESEPFGIGEKPALAEKYEERTDEIGQIYRSFSGMVDRQTALVQDIFIKDLEKKDAELALLQTQINPHFLYNTLNSINWLALANDQEEISRMITALSDTFRLSLMKSKSSFTELEQELAYVKSYLLLQKFRYGSRLEYRFSLPDPLPKLFIPRFVLQPVIENALIHGIDSMEDGGMLDIVAECREEDGLLLLQVGNDNDRIDLAAMERRLEFDPDAGDYLSFEVNGYGVQNINRRIRILCGAAYGLQYRTAQGRTWCTITLPVLREEPAGYRETGEAKDGEADHT